MGVLAQQNLMDFSQVGKLEIFVLFYPLGLILEEIQWFRILRAADPCRSGTMWFQ